MDNWPGEDTPDHASEAAHDAYKALIATKATSVAGVVAQLQGHLRWCDDVDNEEYNALCRIVADLGHFIPVHGCEQAAVDDILDIRSDLETQTAKLDSLENMLRYMADRAEGEDGGPEVGAFWSLMNLVAFIKNDTQALVGRLKCLGVRS